MYARTYISYMTLWIVMYDECVCRRIIHHVPYMTIIPSSPSCFGERKTYMTFAVAKAGLNRVHRRG